MSQADIARREIENLINQVFALLPAKRPAPLPPMKDFPSVPQWQSFEHTLWGLGEKVRHVLNAQPKLRCDNILYSRFFEIASDRRGMRGRQSFVLLFAYKPCINWAHRLTTLLPDSDIEGHVIAALYKMRAKGFSDIVAPYEESRVTWIRKEAIRYLNFDKITERGTGADGVNAPS